MSKKLILALSLLLALTLTACNTSPETPSGGGSPASDESTATNEVASGESTVDADDSAAADDITSSGDSAASLNFIYSADLNAIANWGAMVTPGGGEGSVTKGDEAAIIKAAEDGWGGVQSEPFTIDLSKNPLLFVQIMESNDGFKWGAKFTPSDPVVEDHEWGFYLIADNNFKWNNYAVVDLRERLGDFIDLYGESIEGVLWIYAAGGPEAEVEVTSVKIANQTPDPFIYSTDFDAISAWRAMVTPGGGEGSVAKGDRAATIKAAEDGWGGVQSESITIDLSKDPLLFVQIMECNDGFRWGAKFTPSEPVVEDHEWGFYLIADNDFKWNNYAVVDLKERMSDFIDLYGKSIEGVLWIYAAGSPEAEVEVTSVKIANQK
jgi:hypothetical protein